ncbi:hypothetical protein BJV78DRAFT_1290487 [Lactifluus subvellereus]|nr:hypothetical protein BJV78DRAFT_1290487 [Lactifluus subvellereus]
MHSTSSGAQRVTAVRSRTWGETRARYRNERRKETVHSVRKGERNTHVPQGAPPESAGRPNSAGSIHTATSTTIHLNACSTKLSNVALVAGKTQASNSEPVGVSLGPGGFKDEDETEEREHALLSPIKGNQRLSSAGIVKVTVGAASPVSRSKHSAANR